MAPDNAVLLQVSARSSDFDLPRPLLVRFPVGFLELDVGIVGRRLGTAFGVSSAGNDDVLTCDRVLPIEGPEGPAVFGTVLLVERHGLPGSVADFDFNPGQRSAVAPR